LDTANPDKVVPVVVAGMEEGELLQQERQFKPRFYWYPNWNESSTICDLDDL